MKRNDKVILFAIAFCALYLGMQLAGSLQRDRSHVEVRPLEDFSSFETRLEAFKAKATLVDDTDGAETYFSDAPDIYLHASQWQWAPNLEVQSGREYNLHIASSDIQHGFHISIKATGESIDVLIQPGFEYIITLKNLQPGVFAIGCTEYCGLEHNKMRGIFYIR